MRTRSSKLAEEVTIANEAAQESSEVLEVEPHRISEYLEEAIVDYKSFIRFKKGLERMRVTSYQFRYQITLVLDSVLIGDLVRDLTVKYPILELPEPRRSCQADPPS
ncbi:hypothetical protein BHE74_00021886 [Ensete ventricosum]|nr:hypothetical protein BHE74_00021886 [Ensete ventricosum]